MIRNAIIRKARIVKLEYFTDLRLELEYDKGCQNFGSPKITELVDVLFKITDATDLNALVGRAIRVEQDSGGVKMIGHILHDEWYSVENLGRVIGCLK